MWYYVAFTWNRLIVTGLRILPCNQCWCTTLSRLSTTAAAAHPNKTAPFFGAFGTDGWLTRHVQSPTYVDSRPAQGLEALPSTSTSHLAMDPGSRPSATQPRTELSVTTCPGQRTMEATCGNGYVRVRGSPAMMMMMMMRLRMTAKPTSECSALVHTRKIRQRKTTKVMDISVAIWQCN